MRRSADFQGYGFNLHDEKGVAGHFIGQVDEGSPAEAAGLVEGDKLIEVNGQPVFEDDHHQVVQKVTGHPDEVQLLVMDAESDEYCRVNNVRPHSGMPNIVVLGAPTGSEEGKRERSLPQPQSTNRRELQCVVQTRTLSPFLLTSSLWMYCPS